MRDYKLTLLDDMDVKPGVGFAVYAKLDIFRNNGDVNPAYTTTKRFAFRMNTPDAGILQEIEK